MNRDLTQLILLYVDIDDYYKIHKQYKLTVKFYCEHVDMIPTRHEKSFTDWLFYTRNIGIYYAWACINNYVDVLKFLSKDTGCQDNIMNLAIRYNSLEIVKYLHESGNNIDFMYLFYNPDLTTREYTDLFKYLENIRKITGKPINFEIVMYNAILNNNTDIFQYYHELGKNIMDEHIKIAHELGRLDILHYCHDVGKEFPTRLFWKQTDEKTSRYIKSVIIRQHWVRMCTMLMLFIVSITMLVVSVLLPKYIAPKTYVFIPIFICAPACAIAAPIVSGSLDPHISRYATCANLVIASCVLAVMALVGRLIDNA